MSATSSGGAEQLGPFRLHGVLGEGGMGVVHLGVDPSGRACAVKVLRDHVAHAPEARSRLAREVATLRRVDHPAVAPFLGADVDGPRPYLVTRYVPGEPLDQWVAEHGPLTGEPLRAVALRLVDALEAIHAAGVVHRDFKPGNVLMPDGAPVVIDFGIAHVADESRLTATGLVMGTPGYLAPEVLDGLDVSPATDVWGLGATLVFAATGRSPFGTGPTPAVLDRVARGAVDLRGLSPWLTDLARRMLAPRPEHRPTLDDLRAELTRADADFSVIPLAEATSRPYADGRTEAVPAPEGVVRGGEPTFALGAGAVGAAAAAARTQAVPGPPAGVGRAPGGPSLDDDRAASPRPTTQVPLAGGDASEQAGAAATSSAAPQGSAAPTTVNPVLDTRVMPTVPRPDPAPQATPAASSPYAGFGSPQGAVLPSGTHPQAPWAPPAGAPGAPNAGPVPGAGGPFEPSVAPGGPYPGLPVPAPGAPLDGQPAALNGATPVGPVSRRAGTLASLALVLLTLTGWLTGLGILVALLWSTLARMTDRIGTSLALRRAERGPRDRDAAIAVLGSPVHLLGAALSALVTAILPTLVGVAFTAGLHALAGSGAGRGGSPASGIMIGMAAGLIVAWWGPGGGSLRRGSRTIVRGVLPGRTAALAVSIAGLGAAAVMFLITQSSGWTLSWWPFDGLARWLLHLARVLDPFA